MTTRIALLTAAVSVAVLAACGDTGPSSFAFTTGTYAVSNATATTGDSCGILPSYQAAGKKIGVVVGGADGGTVTFNLSNDPTAAASTNSSAVINGNVIDTPTAANYTIALQDGNGADCGTMKITGKQVTGNLLADNEASLDLTFSADWDVQGSCTADDFLFAAVPCSSAINFTATKQ